MSFIFTRSLMKANKAVILFFAGTVVILILLVWASKAFGLKGLSFALLANLLVMDWAAIIESHFGDAGRFFFPDRYYHCQRFERQGTIYSILGVGFFRRLVRMRPFSALSPNLRFAGKLVLLNDLEKETRAAETAHAVMFLIILAVVLYALIARWFDAAVWLLFFNVVLNLYPVMLQRYNRIRMTRLIRWRDKTG